MFEQDNDLMPFPKLKDLASVRQLGAHELLGRMGHDDVSYTLIDVREEDEIVTDSLGVIEGSTSVPLSRIKAWAQDVGDSNAHYVFVCRSGVRSNTAAGILKKSYGLQHVFNLKGGLLEWNENGLPTFSIADSKRSPE